MRHLAPSESATSPQKSHLENIATAGLSKAILTRSTVDGISSREGVTLCYGMLALRWFLPTTECSFDFLRDSNRQMIAAWIRNDLQKEIIKFPFIQSRNVRYRRELSLSLLVQHVL